MERLIQFVSGFHVRFIYKLSKPYTPGLYRVYLSAARHSVEDFENVVGFGRGVEWAFSDPATSAPTGGPKTLLLVKSLQHGQNEQESEAHE